MGKVSVPKYVVALAVVSLIAACTQTPFQLKKDSAETLSQPDCSKNYSSEMSFADGWEYKTWVRYKDVDFRKAFEAAELSAQKMGYRVILVDRDSGRITAEKINGARPQIVYSMNVKIDKEDQSLVVYLSTKAPRGAIDSSNLCGFYGEFEKAKSRKTTEPSRREVPASLEKKNEASQSAASPGTTASTRDPSNLQPFSLTPPLSSTPKRTAQVKWSNVNLREGPGINFKVVGNITKGTALSILEEKGQWVCIQTGEGKEAWVYKSAISGEGTKSESQDSPPAQKPKPAKVASPM
jgi:SH3-like domain-containing protein